MKANSISIKKATLLNATAKYTTVFLQLIYTAILSRILSPEEYGIVAIINVFIVFFQLFTDMGLGAAIIQDKSLTNKEIRDIYSYSVYIGLLLMIVFSLFSFPISHIYNDKIYISLGIELSFALMFNAFNMVPNSLLLKEKKFKLITIRTIVVNIVSFSITIVLALNGWGVYALAFNSVISAAGIFLWNIITTKLKFTLRPEFSAIKKVYSYSVYQFGAQALNYFNRNMDNLLIGKFLSPTALGYYNKAYTLIQYPITYLPGVITPVLHPILSEYKDKPEYIYKVYMKMLKLLSLLGCFCATFFFFTGSEIITIAFGTQWENAIIPFKIISLSLWMQILTNTIAPIYQSLGDTKTMFKSTAINTLIIVVSIILGILKKDINFIAIMISGAYIINFFISFFILIKYAFKYRFRQFLIAFWQDTFIYLVLLLIAIFWGISISNVFLSLLIKLLVFTSVYIVLLLVLGQHKMLKK